MTNFLMKPVYYLKKASVLELAEAIVVVTILIEAKSREVNTTLLLLLKIFGEHLSYYLSERSFKKSS